MIFLELRFPGLPSGERPLWAFVFHLSCAALLPLDVPGILARSADLCLRPGGVPMEEPGRQAEVLSFTSCRSM